MGLDRIVRCDIKGCDGLCIAKHDGEGWPGWGSIHGLIDDNGNDTAYLCPEHMGVIKKLLNGEGV